MSLTTDEKNAINNLKEVVKILNSNKIDFWMHGAAILGYTRDKSHLISWDRDFDLLTWQENMEKIKKIVPQLNKKGFNTKITKDKIKIWKDDYDFTIGTFILDGDMAVRPTVSVRNKFGVFLYYKLIIKTKRKFILKPLLYLGYITGSIIPVRKFIPSKYFTDLKEMDFYGVKIKVPRETIDYLQFKYGETWRTPIKNWSHKGLSNHYKDDKFNAYYKRGWL